MRGNMNKTLLLLPAFLMLMLGCSEESTGPGTDVETGPPKIQSIAAEKLQILYGGQDPTVLTCNATGGNLKYVWEVDLGDIIPLNTDHSKVSFNGSACCIGEKTITCTVSNSLGSDAKSIVITILEVINVPEIIALESDKTQISAGSGESAALVCYAIGGNLTYAWSADCGEVTVDPNDASRATLAATTDCVGPRTVTCRVSNEKGEDVKSLQITIVN